MRVKDHFITGLIAGIIAPPVTFSLFSVYNFPERTIYNTLRFYYRGSVMTHVISLSVLINLIIFYFFLRSKKEEAAKGVIGATFAYVIVVLILMIIA